MRDWQTLSHVKMSLQISYNICNEIQASNHIWETEKENRGNYQRFVSSKGMGVA